MIGANIAYAKNDLPVYWTFYAPDLTQWWPRAAWTCPTYKKQWEKFVKDGGRIEQADVSGPRDPARALERHRGGFLPAHRDHAGRPTARPRPR